MILKRISLLLLLCSVSLWSEVSTDNQAQGLLSIFEAAQAGWVANIVPAALWLFWTLVLIDWVWTFGMMALKGTDLSEILATTIQKILIIGLFLMLFQFTTWLDTIPQSLSQLADNANALATPIQPDTILEQGFTIVGTIWESISIFDSPGDSIGLMISGLVILLAFIIMTAMFFVVLVKIYLLTVGAYIVLALGGLSYTRSTGINPLIAIFKAGLELFFIKLLLGFSINTINTMAANVGTDNNSIMAMIGVSLLIAALVSMVNGLVESLTYGTLGTNGTLPYATKSSMQGVGIGAVGGIRSALHQVKVATQVQDAANSNPKTNVEKIMQGAVGTFKYAGAMTLGASAGATSGLVKGASGNSTVGAGDKVGRMSGKLFAGQVSQPSNNEKKGLDTDTLEGTIRKAREADNSTNTTASSSDSNYISGVPKSQL